MPARTFSDADLCARAVALARRAHSRHTDPRAVWFEVWRGLDTGVSDDTDAALMTCKEAILKIAADNGAGMNYDLLDEQVLEVIVDLADRAYWLGLTQGHIRLGFDLELPYRLFPELAGMGDAL
jgi:hypothetical protein